MEIVQYVILVEVSLILIFLIQKSDVDCEYPLPTRQVQNQQHGKLPHCGEDHGYNSLQQQQNGCRILSCSRQSLNAAANKVTQSRHTRTPGSIDSGIGDGDFGLSSASQPRSKDLEELQHVNVNIAAISQSPSINSCSNIRQLTQCNLSRKGRKLSVIM